MRSVVTVSIVLSAFLLLPFVSVNAGGYGVFVVTEGSARKLSMITPYGDRRVIYNFEYDTALYVS